MECRDYDDRAREPAQDEQDPVGEFILSRGAVNHWLDSLRGLSFISFGSYRCRGSGARYCPPAHHTVRRTFQQYANSAMRHAPVSFRNLAAASPDAQDLLAILKCELVHTFQGYRIIA